MTTTLGGNNGPNRPVAEGGRRFKVGASKKDPGSVKEFGDPQGVISHGGSQGVQRQEGRGVGKNFHWTTKTLRNKKREKSRESARR